ncbi:hypothetical protein M408DRAFT_326044 [Serendipita vermifera MAFF 305830]|uniref:Cytochrome P450 n=1 Tax=Serendipita vermifera MAFF 305830 TaxID=933852 RepID=A0A0C2X571_SERVB|nr:hypothetical protein M408DRAFT_326044 [Serendipita vermifera MAFF 305830]
MMQVANAVLDRTKTSYALGIIAATGGLAWLLSRKPYVHEIGGRKSPPGPKRKLLIGNAKNFPTTKWMEAFSELQKTYGDIIYFQVPGRGVLVLNSLEDAEDLLGKRANIWSARPESYIVMGLMEFGWALPYLVPGNDHNEQRKIFHQVIGPRAVTSFDTMLHEGADEFCKSLHGFSGDPEDIVSHAIGQITIRIAYGDEVHREHGDELVQLNSEGITYSTWCTQQLWLVNVFPLARYLPSWFPGVKFHSYVTKGKDMFSKIRVWAFGMVKEKVDQGTADLSVISKYLGDDERSNEYLRDATALMYLGGVDTTYAAIMSFFANMILYPEVQRKIHHELNEVVGHGRSPTVSDLSSLTYLRAVWKESFRMTPVAPTAVPHASTSDDNWKGYFLPKGTMIVPNVGFMLVDPRHWGNDANVFKPERFLGPGASSLPDVESLTFGFGRRRCPGRYLAERNGLLYIAAALSAYEIRPAADMATPVSITFSDNKIRRPTNLKCQFVSRR